MNQKDPRSVSRLQELGLWPITENTEPESKPPLPSDLEVSCSLRLFCNSGFQLDTRLLRGLLPVNSPCNQHLQLSWVTVPGILRCFVFSINAVFTDLMTKDVVRKKLNMTPKLSRRRNFITRICNQALNTSRISMKNTVKGFIRFSYDLLNLAVVKEASRASIGRSSGASLRH